jgi:hypothetical protein
MYNISWQDVFKLRHLFFTSKDRVTIQTEVKPVLAFSAAFGKIFKFIRAFLWEEQKVW